MIKSITDINLQGKKVLIRADLNVPLQNGIITNTTRIDAFLPTLQLVAKQATKVFICSHLGRPKEGIYDDEFSLKPIATYLSKILQQDIPLVNDYLDGFDDSSSNIFLLENVRFNSGEKANNSELGKKYANLCDVFVMDAFGTAHRAHASTYSVAEQAKEAGAGLLLSAEINALNKALANPAKPLIAIVGGGKVSSKLHVLNNLAKLCDALIVGGAIANTFLAAKEYKVGKSLFEPDLVSTAKHIMSKINIVLPDEVIVKNSVTDAISCKSIQNIDAEDVIFDLKPNNDFIQHITNAKTILWNGPIGLFEQDEFSTGTKQLAQLIAKSTAFSVAGGGDTLAAIAKFGINDNISYISTGGGAFLEFVEGKILPAIAVLQHKYQEN